MEYFLLLENEQRGPYNGDSLASMVRGGEISSNTLAWHEGMSDWAPLNQILSKEAAPSAKLRKNLPLVFGGFFMLFLTTGGVIYFNHIRAEKERLANTAKIEALRIQEEAQTRERQYRAKFQAAMLLMDSNFSLLRDAANGAIKVYNFGGDTSFFEYLNSLKSEDEPRIYQKCMDSNVVISKFVGDVADCPDTLREAYKCFERLHDIYKAAFSQVFSSDHVPSLYAGNFQRLNEEFSMERVKLRAIIATQDEKAEE